MANFMVVVSDNPPAADPPNLSQEGFWVCGQFAGNPIAKKPARVSCRRPPTGRYVYIMVPGHGQIQLCEVEVWGQRKLDHVVHKTGT